MRVAVIVAVRDPRSSDAGTWGDAVASLAASLAGLGFRVAVVDAADDAEAELKRALEGMSAEDALLVHLSGRLARKGVLRMAGGRWLPLRAVGDAIAVQPATDVTVISELLHEDDAEDALLAADHVATAVSALAVRERGFGAVVAVRPASAPVEGMALTRLFVSVAREAERGESGLSSVYGRVRAMPESLQVAQGLTLVRGRLDLDLAPPPASPEVLADTISEATDAKDWPRVLELRRKRLRTLTQPRARVRELVAIARVLQAELGDAPGAIDALEAARAIDPRRPGVLQALRRGYETMGRWASALEVLGALVDLGGSPAERAALRFAQARIALEHLQEEERAATWLEAALADDPGHEQARAALAELRAAHDSIEVPTGKYVAQQAVAAAVALELSPEPSQQGTGDLIEAAAHARAFDVRRQTGHTDAAFLSALALEELGVAEVDHQVLIEQFRSVAPVRARGALDDAAWALLRAPGSDEVLDALFAAVARAAITARVEQLAAGGRLVALDPATRLEAGSTASVVRSFQWAARVLGVSCPELFVVDDVPGDIAAVRAHEPSTAVGPSIVRGRSAKDLAFLAGRHLAYYRAAAQVLVYFPTREELTRLLLAGVQLVSPEEDDGDVEGRAIAALCARIDRELRDDERAGVVDAVQRLQARGGRASLGKWTRSVELTAARAGLFLSGDLATATAILRTEVRGIAGLSADAKRRDLVAFCASDEHAALRARFVVTAPESVRPPPPPAPAAHL